MIANFHDNEARHLLEDRKRQRDNEWLKRRIGDATYLRSLFILGYGDRDATTELNLLKVEPRLQTWQEDH